jgi:hypothetical protein
LLKPGGILSWFCEWRREQPIIHTLIFIQEECMRRTTHFRGDAVLPSVRQSVSPAIRQSGNPSFCQIIANCSPLTKAAASNIRMVRDLRVLTGDDVAILGITDLTYVGQDASRNDIEWFPLSDTLVIGHDLQAHELLRSGVFTPASGASLEYSGMVYCSEPTAMPVGVSLSAQVRRVSDNAVLLNQSLALRNIPADTAIWHAWTRNLSQLPSVPVYLSLGVDGTLPNGVTIGTSKVYLEDQYIPKLAAREEVLPNGVADFELGQNHPNPFNPTTTIPFTLNREQQVRLVVYDQLGREIAVLADGVLSGGSHERVFDAAQLPAGVYHYQLTGSSATETRTLTLLK